MRYSLLPAREKTHNVGYPSAGDIKLDFPVLDHVEEVSDERELERKLQVLVS